MPIEISAGHEYALVDSENTRELQVPNLELFETLTKISSSLWRAQDLMAVTPQQTSNAGVSSTGSE